MSISIANHVHFRNRLADQWTCDNSVIIFLSLRLWFSSWKGRVIAINEALRWRQQTQRNREIVRNERTGEWTKQRCPNEWNGTQETVIYSTIYYCDRRVCVCVYVDAQISCDSNSSLRSLFARRSVNDIHLLTNEWISDTATLQLSYNSKRCRWESKRLLSNIENCLFQCDAKLSKINKWNTSPTSVYKLSL